jgi:aldose 1-epimerase
MVDLFGNMPDGQPVQAITIGRGRLQARVLTLGAIVQDLRLAGVAHPLVLGAASVAPYLGPMRYFGAMCGRFANRIAQGQFAIDGHSYHLSQNEPNGNCLHGGSEGSSQRLWTLTAQDAVSVTLSLTLADGEMGFPGQMDVGLCITVSDTAITFDTQATTDRATPCSFAHHGYFCLDDTGSIAEHDLRIAAEHYLPVTPQMIPTGQIASVADTPFDHRTPRSLRAAAIDHNFCLPHGPQGLRDVAWLTSRHSRITMTMATTAPGLQVFTATSLPQSGAVDLSGRALARHAGIAMEAQEWPDAPNQPHFPPAILRPGDIWTQSTRYSFDHPIA